MKSVADRRDVRTRDVERRRRDTAANREAVIPPCADRKRRELLEGDDCEWLRFYFHELFTYPFTGQQRAMIEAIQRAIDYGGDQALAASRGEGKTKLAERELLKKTLQGVLPFSVLFAATGSKAVDSLKSLRYEIENNERLRLDYPEVCIPVVALQNTPNRAHYQTVSGHRHDNGEPFDRVLANYSWCGDELVFPYVPGSPSAHAIIATRGLDAEVRGLNKGNKRPRLAVIDDPDTEETVRNEQQAKKLSDRIDRGIGGLGGQQKALARVMLTTLQRRDCVSAWYTDPSRKPSFKGKRFKYLLSPPMNAKLWEEYVSRWQADKQLRDEDGNYTDEFSRGAHNFYLENREAMDAGAEVANPHRFDPTILPDGSQLEVSSLQSYFNFVAKNGIEAARAELDNDPVDESGIEESGINAQRICKQLSGFPRYRVPPGCTLLTMGVDVGKYYLHWVVRAWRPEGDHWTGFTLDYGQKDVYGTARYSDDGVDTALKTALTALIDERRETEYETETGERHTIALTLVDARYRTDAIYSACMDLGPTVRPVMGLGNSNSSTYREVKHKTADARPRGIGYHERRARFPGGSIWVVHAHADQFKAWEHDRWLSDPTKPGALYLWGEPSGDRKGISGDELDHQKYARHIVAETEVEEDTGNGRKRYWKKRGGENHWLDASYYSDVAAFLEGVTSLSINKPKPPRQYIDAAKLQQMGRR